LQFTRLKLVGFKSFVEPTDLVIEPGLTGIVGPNGCGKSNLVEALRWVMGETSAKQIRGGEMDDVIFAGTAERPAHNLAEVSLVLDNGERDAPAAYNEDPELEVSRRIERGSGSNYRINGREVRARDVQILFADAASGARSTALVSQGQIGQLISAKPTQRRHLLEEAAGITGLHTRRHEAELRLRAAETNLDRLEDVIAALESQMQALKRQSRQAARYRSLSGRLRKAEAALFYRRWQQARDDLAAAEAAMAEVEQNVAETTRVAAEATTLQAGIAEGLPELRRVEAEAAAALHRLEIEGEAIADEERRLAAATAECEAQLETLGRDLAREGTLAGEAETAVRELATEKTGLERDTEGAAGEQEKAAESLERERATLETIDGELAERTAAVAAAEVRHADLARRQDELETRLASLDNQFDDVTAQRAAIAARLADATALGEAESALGAARQQVAAAHTALEESQQRLATAEGGRTTAGAAERAARETLREAEMARQRTASEAAALAAALDHDSGGTGKPLIDGIAVLEGLELALGAALGDDLMASTDPTAAAHWHDLGSRPAGPALPAGAEPLADFLEAPAALEPRFAQVGLVEAADGARLQAELAQGQRLVSRDGDLWRWDGFTSAADSHAGAAARLRRRQHLEGLLAELPALEEREEQAIAAVDTAAKNLGETQAAYEAARARESAARNGAREADNALDAARTAHAKANDAVAEDRSRDAALVEAAARLTSDRDDTAQVLRACAVERAEAEPLDSLRGPLDALRQRLATQRITVDECARAHERLVRAAEARAERLAAITTDSEAWRRRAGASSEQIASLEERRAAIAERLQGLQEEPARLTERRNAIGERIDVAAAARRDAADRLAAAETGLREADALLKAANEAMAEAREERVRGEGARDQARSLGEVEAEHIQEKFQVEPAALLEIAEAKSADALDVIGKLQRAVERLQRERETMGAVNLRADAEAAELTEQIETMVGERDDLIAAIAKLRGGIASLNREGRARLLAAFEQINGHFQTLFERLFGGGTAHLDLVGDDDPLEAGLEVMASPPGKRLQNLSLLSGGEKALSALALLFAVFLTKPTPICVLDEVDAPLDDANVDRFCKMVEEIAETSATRFLVVTHHRLTMARMSRLFGVTMGERGVSQLVSVDMSEAELLQAAE
jgi:chromosome segregation protein